MSRENNFQVELVEVNIIKRTMRTKILLLPQMLYAAPIWARKHLQALNKLQHKALKLILGTNTTFNQLGAEILCGERHFYFSEL